jgi:hypothetical protein
MVRFAGDTAASALGHMRHTFAVRSLEECAGDRKAVARHMAALSTYPGHAHVSDTCWYLQATRFILLHLPRRLNRFSKPLLSTTQPPLREMYMVLKGILPHRRAGIQKGEGAIALADSRSRVKGERRLTVRWERDYN